MLHLQRRVLSRENIREVLEEVLPDVSVRCSRVVCRVLLARAPRM